MFGATVGWGSVTKIWEGIAKVVIFVAGGGGGCGVDVVMMYVWCKCWSTGSSEVSDAVMSLDELV